MTEFFFFNFRPTDWTNLARHKSTMQGINRPWPKHRAEFWWSECKKKCLFYMQTQKLDS